MDITATIQLITTILSSGIVLVILRQQIKSQQEQMAAMKTNMDSMKALSDMFKVDELEKFYERKIANAVQDALENTDIYVVEEIQRILKSDLESQKLLNDLHQKQSIMQKYAELLATTCIMLKGIPADKRNNLIDKKYPNNSHELKEQLKLII